MSQSRPHVDVRLALGPTLALGLLLASTPARAEPTPEERSLAATLFAEGRRLLDAGQVAEACERLAESQRLDPGGGTLLNLAMCRKLEGRTATAHSLFTEALAAARRDGRTDRIAICQAELADLAGRLATVVVFVAEDAAAPGLEVFLNGVRVPPLAWATPVPVDPGPILVEARAPGRVPHGATIEVAPAAREQVLFGPLALAPAAPPPAPTPAPSAARDDAATPEPAHEGPRPAAHVRVDVDGKLRGATVFVAAAAALTSAVEVSAGPLLGGTLGVELDARFLPWKGAVRPFALVGMPIFFEGDAYVGARGSLGLEVHVAGPVAVLGATGAAFFPSAPEGFDRAIFLPSLGVLGRL